MNTFLHGAIAMACWVCGLFFLRFWRETHDRLFLFFFPAFWLFSTHWLALASVDPNAETRPYLYTMRLVVFALIAAGVIDKNRRSA